VDLSTSRLPLVHQIWFSLSPDPDEMPLNCQEILKIVGEDRYRLWTLSSARRFLVDEFDESVVAAFDRLKPFAYKADLVRYCVVLKLGGFYLDQSVKEPRFPPTGAFDFIGFRDPNSEFSSWKVGIGFFFARAGSTILEDSICQILENCEHEYYGKDPHYPTGPSVFGRSIAKLAPELDVMIGQYYWLRRRRNKYVLPGYGVVGRGKVGGQSKGGVSGIPGGNNYNQLWRSRDVYQ
jgi:hypothetical protein